MRGSFFVNRNLVSLTLLITFRSVWHYQGQYWLYLLYGIYYNRIMEPKPANRPGPRKDCRRLGTTWWRISSRIKWGTWTKHLALCPSHDPYIGPARAQNRRIIVTFLCYIVNNFFHKIFCRFNYYGYICYIKLINMEITQLELSGLKAITQSDYYENGRGSIVWDWSVYDCCPFSGKTRSGVFSSLSQKGLVIISEPEKRFHIINGEKVKNRWWTPDSKNEGTIRITEAGYSLLDEAGLINEWGRFLN